MPPLPRRHRTSRLLIPGLFLSAAIVASYPSTAQQAIQASPSAPDDVPATSSPRISATAAVDDAMRNSPRVLTAQADVARALAVVQQARDVYIPSLSVGGSGYGKSYGFPLGQPTVFTVQAQSLVFSFSQRDYIRSARAGLDAASRSLADTRETVTEDTLIAYLTLAHDSDRQRALNQQMDDVTRLIDIIQQRLSAGQDTPTDLTGARLSAAQIHLRLLQTEDDINLDRIRLSHLIGLAPDAIRLSQLTLPTAPAPAPSSVALAAPTTPGIQALYDNARARREQAFGDRRYLFRPQLSFAAQYSALSTFSNSNYLEYFGRRDPNGMLIGFPSYAIGVGVQLTVPILDYVHRARARESLADANHAQHDADEQRNLFLESRVRTARTREELAARSDIATLDQQLAAQQLQILQIQLQSPGGSATPMTPKDEQNARITERDKYLTLLDARFDLQRTSITLLRQTGQLEAWLRTLPQGPTTAAPDPQSANPSQSSAHAQPSSGSPPASAPPLDLSIHPQPGSPPPLP